MVRATTTTGRDVTLTRAAIVEEEGRTDLVGRAMDLRNDDETERLDLATVTTLEMRLVGPSTFTMSRTQVMALLTVAVLVLLFG
jgi:hypothetical protein